MRLVAGSAFSAASTSQPLCSCKSTLNVMAAGVTYVAVSIRKDNGKVHSPIR